jgi:hypothetical protein
VQSDISELLGYLMSHGMLACLQEASALLQQAGLTHLLEASMQGPPATAGPDASSAEQATQQRAAAAGSTAAPGATDDKQVWERAATAAAGSTEAGSLRQATRSVHAPHLPWRHVLRGFPDPSAEEAYAVFKNDRCCARVDPLAAVFCVMIFGLMQGGRGQGPGVSADISMQLAGLMFNVSWVVMLLVRPSYRRHREALLLLFGGGGRAIIALVVASSLLSGTDQCSSVQHCMSTLAVSTALHFPLCHQLRFKHALVLTSIDAAGLAAYCTFVWGSLAAGLAAGAAAAATGLATTALLERRSRALYASRQAAAA